MKRPAAIGLLFAPAVLLPVVFWTNPGFLSGPHFGVGNFLSVAIAVIGTYALSMLVLVPVVFVLTATRALSFLSVVVCCTLLAYTLPFAQLVIYFGWSSATDSIGKDLLSYQFLGWAMYGAILGAAFSLIVGLPVLRSTGTVDKGGH